MTDVLSVPIVVFPLIIFCRCFRNIYYYQLILYYLIN